MKNIFELMKEYGLELPEDKKKDFEKVLLENYKTVKDYDAQKEKLTTAEAKVGTQEQTILKLQEDLKKVEGVDVSGLQKQITDLQKDLADKDAAHQKALADRDFEDLLTDQIRGANGKNAKAIRALLDVETLKASKNQKDDVAAALKALTEAEDSKMLFASGDDESYQIGNIIGNVRKKSGGDDDAAMRAAMGLPPVSKKE